LMSKSLPHKEHVGASVFTLSYSLSAMIIRNDVICQGRLSGGLGFLCRGLSPGPS
jgi:hypothetical protein